MSYLQSDIVTAQFFKNQAAKANKDLIRLNADLVTGRISNLAQRRDPLSAQIQSIEKSLVTTSAFETVQLDATLFLDRLQLNLNKISNITNQMSKSFLSGDAQNDPTYLSRAAKSAQENFNDIVAALNSNIAGRHLFSGQKTTIAPLPNGESMLSALHADLSGAENLKDLETLLDSWFDAPDGAFYNQIYKGAVSDLTSFQISQNSRLNVDITAQDGRIRSLLKTTALAALSDQTQLSTEEREQIISTAGAKLHAVNGSIVDAAADIGTLQSRLEATKTDAAAQKMAINLHWNTLTSSDPYETSASLKEAQNHLTRLYVLTAELFELSFVDYMS